ncbi:MAG: rhodanese-like domain-containing protein [Pseudodesulfovibrio sp.]|jgi:glyoxylase-like metal-dependent hydrolase (beta-lactamase superfamily II)/rhodanese-related sulfurtransferase|uniref:MBL fold metallo-hydrolase n=1 Tax=Pseudodesulfovibrio indicus TaxID=1716143 RepID=A0A126QNT5_9BACT|nr:MBL fold metallo-hydrolase [Pseudodesulfovibrio indicus]AMK11642.1 MBL fold metallo-hydrolase [Pseudodesulfovibrio indicus]TDT90052.1 rhodanese-related sulfurtransferase [Pseudodesulfovibrio indicus]
MYFKQITTPGLGCFSYVIGCPAAGEMVVVDPKRDVQDYLDISRDEGMKIVHVIDTHVHADHVSGAQELKSQTGCDIMVYETSPVSYDFTPLKEGRVLEVGNAKLEVLHTPGHTPDALSLLVTDTTRGDEPWMLLTGDVLFVNDIGRPDLVGGAKLNEQVQNLWNTLYVKFAKFPDSLEVFPAHGAGSLCGRGMSSKPSSTLGFERRHNPMLGFDSFEKFHLAMSQNFPARPKSFTHIIATNAGGAPLLERCPLDLAMNPFRFEEKMQDGAVVIDVRDAAAFAGYHIPGSLNIGFEPSLANWVGMTVEPDADILLVVDSRDDYERMRTELHRIGYDNIHGYLSGGIQSWVYSGRPVDSLAIDSAQALQNAMDEGKEISLIDVRTPGEWEGGKIPGARHIPLIDILDGKFDLDEDKNHLLYCAAGYRANIAASYLQKHGYWNVRSLAGGYIAWSRAGFKTV